MSQALFQLRMEQMDMLRHGQVKMIPIHRQSRDVSNIPVPAVRTKICLRLVWYQTREWAQFRIYHEAWVGLDRDPFVC